MKKKFVASYSSGKDSTLSVYKAIQNGMQPLGLIITYNTDIDRMWFHGLSEPMIEKLSQCLEIPIELIRTSGDRYEENFEKKLIEYEKKGAEVCVFGDIDIQEHLDWGIERCRKANLDAYYPLWQMNRRQAVMDFIENGFITHITTVNTNKMDIKYLGRILDRQTVAELERDGVDVCGENGEYHTLVTDGPLFKRPLSFTFGEPVIENGYAKLPVE